MIDSRRAYVLDHFRWTEMDSVCERMMLLLCSTISPRNLIGRTSVDIILLEKISK